MEEIEKTTLGSLGMRLDSTAKKYPVLIGENLGHRTLTFSMPINQFINISGVGSRKNIHEIEEFAGEFHAQRNLIRDHAVGLAKYTLMGLVRSEIKDRLANGIKVSDDIIQIQKGLGDPAYASLQPIVCNIRKCEAGGEDLEVSPAGDRDNSLFYVTLTSKHILWVVDGQHRREGFDILLSFLTNIKNRWKYPKRGLYEPTPYFNEYIPEHIHEFWMSVYETAMSRCQVSIECHLGLKDIEERQLFHDLNSKGRKVQASLSYQYDYSDPINTYVANVLIKEDILSFTPSDKDESNWKEHDGSISRKDVNNCTALACLGKLSSKSATPAIVESKQTVLTKFWEAVGKINSFGSPGAKMKTVAAQPVVLKSLAKLTNDLAFGHQNIRDENGLKILFEALRTNSLDFSHQNPLWQALLMEEVERKTKFPGIDGYLYIPPDTNLDVGVFDATNKWMRFGNRHNDIFPRLGDCIRWKLDLKPRPSVVKAIEESND